MSNAFIRPLTTEDQPDLWPLLYIALWTAPNEPAHAKSVVLEPHIRPLIEHWGRQQDLGFGLQLADGTLAGAIWSRLDRYDGLPDYGCPYPCLGLGLMPQAQGQGWGKALMQHFLAAAQQRVPGVRLGVHPQNERAQRLYLGCGFQQYAIGRGDYWQMSICFANGNQSNKGRD